MVITLSVRRLDRELTFHLYHCAGEANQSDDLDAGLRAVGLNARVLRKNPVTDDVWMFVLDLIKNHGSEIGGALVTILIAWLRGKKGRRIEIERPDLKLKASTARELEKALSALHNYDQLRITLNNAKSIKPTKRKSVAKKRNSK